MADLRIDKIDKPNFDTLLSQYHDIVTKKYKDEDDPKKLQRIQRLDELRYETIPARVQTSPKPYRRDEIIELVEWKLKHGTFRPGFLQRVEQNSDQDIETKTQKMFNNMQKGSMTSAEIIAAPEMKLKGIGPATTSLLLSCYDPESIPFFSDELYMYANWDELGMNGWKSKLKYNKKEYDQLLKKVDAFRKRTGFKAIDLEKVAYVLGYEKVDLSKFRTEESSVVHKSAADPTNVADPEKRKRKRKAHDEDNNIDGNPEDDESAQHSKSKSKSSVPSSSSSKLARKAATMARSSPPSQPSRKSSRSTRNTNGMKY